MATATNGMAETYMTTMTPEEWANVPDNPRQRDTDRRSKTAKHLHTLESSHTLVHMAEWEGGRCKLEGHTRAKVWTDMPDIAPESVDVRVYLVQDEAEAKRLYGQFNSIEEVEKVTDRLFGALRECSITAESSFVTGCRFTNAVRTAHTYATSASVPTGGKKPPVHEGVRFFREEIIALDLLNLPKDKAIGCAVCCFLMARKKHGNVVDKFFSRYKENAGMKLGRNQDCVQVFANAITENRKQSGGGFTHFHDAVCIGLACIDRWIKDDRTMLSRSPKCDPFRYLG
jgi:hypothetical protein